MKSPTIVQDLDAKSPPLERPSSSSHSSAMQARAYQVEMFEESVKRNTIICMSTGSGKTQIAKLRIEAELKKSTEKRVWFLAPSVALCQQQYAYLSSQLPAHQFRLLTSLDKVEHWSTQTVWDAALWNMEVIISTPQPLLDALSHGFVHMSGLSLLTFDEAHHCTKNAPMNRIMQVFYHPVKRNGSKIELPHILGLSASPVTSSKTALETLERNLDAICKTPTRQIDDYKQFVHEPKFLVIPYNNANTGAQSPILNLLRQTIDNLDINDDPYVHFLRHRGTEKSQESLLKILSTRETTTFKQLRALDRRTNDIYNELGNSAANEFVAECIMRLQSSDSNLNRLSITLSGREWMYLDTILSQVRSDVGSLLETKLLPDQISPKVTALVGLLKQEYASNIRCVIFVKQRSAAWALSHLLNLHPECQGMYSAEPFVGLSRVDRNLQIVDLVKMRDPSEVLANFRSGKANIVVATSVMEEGVDIPATNLVIRFDDSENFRSFIQSRGRARHPDSKFVTLLQDGFDGKLYKSWKLLEIEMKAKYADEYRQNAELEADFEHHSRQFSVGSTGATLTLESAIQHIEHFCSKLPRVAYVDAPRPEFILTRITDTGVRAKIILPTSVDCELRQFSGSLCKTERTAKKDAAFEAYLGLYRAGLVNDNFLPTVVPETQDATSIQIEIREGMCQTRSRLNPWREIAMDFNLENVNLSILRVAISGTEQPTSSLLLLLPRAMKTSFNVPLLWSPSSTFIATVTPFNEELPTSFDVATAQKVTHYLLKTIYDRKMQHRELGLKSYPCMVVPEDYVGSLKEWLENPLEMMPEEDKISLESHLVRRQNDKILYFFRGVRGERSINKHFKTRGGEWSSEGSIEPSSEPDDDELDSEIRDSVDVMRLPKRVDFLHPTSSNKAHTAWEPVPWSECCIENLPASFARTMLFIPSILHIVEIGLVSWTAANTILSPIGFHNLENVMTALSASAAQESINYQSLEFLGDSLLKYYTTINLFARYPKWHEGYLSRKKDSIVSNARLCRAALDLGLDSFIHTESFAGAQWKVCTNEDLKGEAEDQLGRCLSTKVLADVVEALIGAAYVDGIDSNESESRSLACLRLFLPELPWDTTQGYIVSYQYPQLPDDISTNHLTTVETMIDYKFKARVLVAEALTHPSAIAQIDSYQRLEHLGDALLDHIVVANIFRLANETLRPFTMHLIRAAVVNADFLAFLCLEITTDLERLDIATNNVSHESTITSRTERKYLCQYMTVTGNMIMSAQQACIQRYLELHEKINKAIKSGTRYPWSLLIRLGADKFFSDIIESLLGAIYLDSRGSIPACEDFLRKIGLLSYLQRLINEPRIEIMHPKEKLGVDSGNAKLTYESSVEYRDNGEAIYSAKILKDGDLFATSREGFSKLEAETMAAEEAIAKLAAEKQQSQNASVE